MIKNNSFVSQIINLALAEDFGFDGDVTSNCVLNDEHVNFAIVAREDLLLSGVEIAEIILNRYSNDINYTICKFDGDFVYKGQNIIKGTALAKLLMSLERTVLNFLQHCSSISSYTKKFVEIVSETKVKIRSTRKTVPGMRFIEKYAVEVGGGENYRNNLSDGILIKDNHIASCGSIAEAINRVRNNIIYKQNLKLLKKIAIECDNITQVRDACSLNVDLILLDNMSLYDLKKSVEIVQNTIKLEATGGIDLSNVLSVANTGVDYISVGAITNSFVNKDIALDIIDFL